MSALNNDNNDDASSPVSSPRVSQQQCRQQHLEWTSIQGHILTGGGKAEEYFIKERGYPF